jgi:hypothetical protein
MLFLKIPIVGMLWIVWWAIHQSEEQDTPGVEGEGGTKIRPPDPHRRGRRPRFPRTRGPHGASMPPAPARTRTLVARRREPKRC